MDLPSKNMYDTLKDEIWKELGPLDPDWFEALTAQAFTNEGNASDQEDLCANQEGHFKTPFDKTAVDSQLFSTPKVFRHRRVVSPETEEPSSTAEQGKERSPWAATQSPCLFQMSKDRVQSAKYGGVQPLSEDSFDVLHTPQKSPASYARLISESLGAEIHPDVSWTSSLNTPPAIASTLILTQPEESPRPVSVSANQSVVFVRKLFPSLSNAMRVGAASAKNCDVPPVHQGVMSPEADQNPERPRSPQASLNQSDCVWRQKLPDAIEDGEIRSTVANVLDGAEDVLSIFFSNSSSALRKVKTDRIKRKQIIPTEEHDCSSTDVSVTNNAASSEQRTAEQEPDRLPSLPPVKTEDKGITQWSPLSLSEIPPFTVDISCSENISEQTEGNMLTEKLQSGFDSGQVVRPHMKITDSGFTKKKRKFVYTVKTSKSQLQGEETESQRTDSSQRIPDCGQEENMKQLAECDVQKQGNLTEENLPHSLQAKVMDFDISQLSRDFAQDFTQIPTPAKLSKLAEETPRNGFSPSACLSAMKRANQKARQAKFYQDCDDVTYRRSVSAANQSNSMNEGIVGDSGFQSAVADITHVTASSFGQSQPWTDFKTSIQKTASFPSTNKENEKACSDAIFQGAETDAKLFSAVKENQTLDPGRESVMCTESTSVQPPSCAKGTADNINCIPPHGQRHGSLPEKTTFPLPSVCAPGFKTASNKGIHISSATLEKAKRLFEETERETAFCNQPIKCAHGSKDQPNLSRGSVTNTACNSNQPLASVENIADNSFQLTASQKAEVTELCTLLEEADSQFEFTQSKTAELKQHCQDNATSPQKVDRELDPDFLAGIDFDDSFNYDAEKQPAVKLMQDTKTSVSDGKSNRETSSVTSKSTGLSSREMKEENPTAENASSSKSIPESINSRMSAETSKLEDKNPLMLGAGFKTAGGNVLRVSKKCLSKARALFADLEESLVASQTLLHKQISENEFQLQHKRSVNNCAGNIRQQNEEGEKVMSSDRQVTDMSDEDMTKGLKNSKVDPTKHQMGFQKASGKEISISEKAMREADAFFKDCKMMDTDPGMSVKHEKSLEASSKSASHEENLQKCKNIQGIKAKLSKEPINEFENVNARPATGHTEALQHNVDIHNFSLKNSVDHTKAGNLSLTAKELSSCTTSKHFVSSAVNGLSSGGGFSTASGKKVLVSADAMKKAKCLLNDTDTLEEAFKQPKQMKDASRTGHHVSETPKNGGFQTASGKGVPISSAALKKAKSLFSECDEIDDKINVKPTYSKMPVPGPPPTHSGFLAASGKPVTFSSEALQKAKALFSDIGFSAQIPAALDTNNGDKKKDAAENIQEMHFGFSTARGAKVHVSEKNLQKAKHLLREFDDMQDAEAFFKDCDIMDSKDGMSVNNRGCLAPVSGSGVEEENLSKFKLEQSVTGNTAEVCGNGCAEPENEQFANHEKMLQSVESLKGGFKNTLHSTSEASSEGKPPSKVKPSLMSAASSSTGIASINELSNNGGFCTASGKKVSVSDEAIRKAKSLFNENTSFEGTNNQLEQRADTLPPLNSGFQTASGKGVAVSSAALTRAKTLLSECDVNDKINVKPTFSEMPISAPPPRNCGFLAASGKKVAFSSEALQKAKALFSDISFSADTATAPETRNSEHSDVQNDAEKIHSGFTTAEGARVHVSQKSLLKDFVNGECHELDSYSTSLQNTHKSDLSNVNHVRRTSNSDLPPAGEKGMAAEKSAPQVVHSLTSLQATDCGTETAPNSTARGCIRGQEKAPTDAFKLKEGEHHDNTGEETTNALNSEINRTGSSAGSKVNGAEESSILYIQSFGLSDCTETQQEFFAREALDCTKALLEDEKFSMTFENLPLQGNQKSSNRRVEEQKRKGKRLEEEEEDMSGQPPLKRRLLEEFDRTVDGPRGSTLHRQISSPNGVMKDRGVFKYSTSLYPNITRPHSSDKNDVKSGLQKTTPTQHLIPGDNRAAHSKTSTFVPPFLKNTESRKNTMLKDNTRTPSAFVPPFKKQRTVVQESSVKAQEEDKSHHVFVTPLESNTCVPPSEKPQTADVTGNKCKEDFQIVALAETTNDDQNNQNVPVGCGSEEAPAEASCLQDTLPRNQDMFQNLHNIELARDMQDMRIRKKKRQTIRPLPGSLFLTKTSGGSRIPLKAAVSGNCPARCSQKQLYIHGVHQHVSEITSETAESFRFSLQHFIKQEAFRDEGGVQLADGGWLVPSTDGSAGKEEFYRALCDTPGVDPKLITEAWVYNHYRWIVWKRASMERSFPETMGSICLTPEQVLLQLKYRYDVEVDHSRRPALRKIMEKDDTAAKTLILCVCGVVSKGLSPEKRSYGDTKTPAADARVENPCAVVWLTDGWYAIKAQLDEPLTAMLHKGRLAVGGKLIIHGAQLVGSQDACSPLEAPDSLMLKICANSSRPARWDAKLGFHRDPRPFLLPVSCLYSNGGPVGCVDVIILRSYPIQWMERKPDGGVVFRSVRAEEKEVRRYNSHKQKAMEVLFAKIQAEFEKDEKGNNKPQRRRRTISRQDIASLQDGEELYEAVGDDPAYLEAHLSEQQLETLRSYRRSQMEKKQAELQDRYRRALENAEDREGSCPKRDVTPVWRLCIADSLDRPGTVYQLNLWRPPSDLQSLLKEGCRYKVYNLTTSEGKKPGGGANVQLSGTKKTQFQDLQASQELLSTHFQQRVSTHFEDLRNPEYQPLCGEVDLTGYVISIIDEKGSSPAFYLVDGKLNFVKVRCFSSLAQSGLEDVIKPRVLLALSNLQLRGQSTSPTPVVYAGDLTVFSTNPKEVHLQESLCQLRHLAQGQENFCLTAEEKLSDLVQSDGLSSVSTPALQTGTPASTTDRRQDTKTSVTSKQPVRSLGFFTPVSRNPQTTKRSTEKDPVSLKRRRALDYLSRIPSPPPISSLSSVAYPCVRKTFNPPRRSGTPSTLKTVQTPARKAVTSPVEDDLVNDEELAMIDTQALLVGDLM